MTQVHVRLCLLRAVHDVHQSPWQPIPQLLPHGCQWADSWIYLLFRSRPVNVISCLMYFCINIIFDCNFFCDITHSHGKNRWWATKSDQNAFLHGAINSLKQHNLQPVWLCNTAVTKRCNLCNNEPALLTRWTRFLSDRVYLVMSEQSGWVVFIVPFMFEQSGCVVIIVRFRFEQSGCAVFIVPFMFEQSGWVVFIVPFMFEQSGWVMFIVPFMFEQSGWVVFIVPFMFEQSGWVVFIVPFMFEQSGWVVFIVLFMCFSSQTVLCLSYDTCFSSRAVLCISYNLCLNSWAVLCLSYASCFSSRAVLCLSYNSCSLCQFEPIFYLEKWLFRKAFIFIFLNYFIIPPPPHSHTPLKIIYVVCGFDVECPWVVV